MTRGEDTDLTLEVAVAHGIRGVTMRPTAGLTSVESRITDGLERGRRFYGHLRPIWGASRVSRVPSFHPQAAGFDSVLTWLEGVEGCSSCDGPSIYRLTQEKLALEGYFPGLDQELDELAVGASLSNFKETDAAFKIASAVRRSYAQVLAATAAVPRPPVQRMSQERGDKATAASCKDELS